MIVARNRAVVLLAATAIAATLAGAAPHSSPVPSTTWEELCPDAKVRGTEAPGWETYFEAFTNRAGTCTVVQNTSPGVLLVSVQSPDSVIFLDGATQGGDPRGPLLTQAGAWAAGKRSDTATQQPVLSNGFAVIQHRPGSTLKWWTQVADQSTQVKAKFAVELSRFAVYRLPWTRWATALAQLDQHIQACAIEADALRDELLAKNQPAEFQDIFNQLPQTAGACKPVYDAAVPPRVPTNPDPPRVPTNPDPPRVPMNPLDTPQANNARQTLQRFNSEADNLARMLRLGRALIS
ncbi:hypothetical protein ABZY34_05275 [Streptomyces virginiae]|uniref:hypothetical protein n=1 Tax=Streptomyces virginiae TaxID=1961 RepID=UPI0033AAB1AC